MARNAQPDLSEFQELQPRIGTRSKADTLRDELTPKDYATLEAAIADPKISPKAINAWLKRRGQSISVGAVRNWRERG